MIPRLHLVTDDAVLQHPAFISTALRIVREVDTRVALHVRAKSLSAQAIFDIAGALRPHAGWLVVNDRVDIALAMGADAVQLGDRSLPVPSVRAMNAALGIGYSAHDPMEALAAERDGADFILAGSIYDTASHPGAAPAGLSLLSAAVAVCGVPVIAIGGVTLERVAEVRERGAHGVAVISAVWHSADPVQAAQQFARLLEV